MTIGQYSVIYADPPWRYSAKNVQGAAEKHYPTMGIDELCTLPVSDLAAPDSVLFLWATFPQLPEALRLIKAWGFTYKSVAFVWLKKNRKSEGWFYGLGEHSRMQDYELRPSRNNLDIRRQMDAQAQVVGKWEDAHRVPDQKRLTWFYPDFGSYVVKEYITPEQLASFARGRKRRPRNTGPRTAPKRKPLTGATDRRTVMEKKHEQDFANQEALRLSGVFNTPIPAQPPEREKALDKVKEPPRVCRSLEREER